MGPIRGVLLTLLAGLSGCQCASPVWEGASLSLPSAEHAYAVPVRSAAMARSVTEKQLQKLVAKHCLLEPPLEEEELPDEDVKEEPQPVEPSVGKSVLSDKLAQGSLLEALSERDEPTKPEAIGREYSASLSDRLPEALVTPAVLTITLDEIRWLGESVIPLQQGRVYSDVKKGNLILPLYEVLNDSVGHTINVAVACGKTWDGSVLLAIDARVPLSTVYPVMYTLGQARFSSFLFMVNDPAPVETRSHAPAAGLAGSGEITVSTREYQWRRIEDTGLDYPDERRVKTTTWPVDAPWPSEIDPARPPKAVILFELNQFYETFIAEFDQLAQNNVFCAVAALGFPEDSPRHPVIPVAESQLTTPLKIDPRGTVAVHVQDLPGFGLYGAHDGLLLMRGDGSRCSLLEMLRTGDTATPSPTREIGTID